MSEENTAKQKKKLSERMTGIKQKIVAQKDQRQKWLRILIIICIVVAALVILCRHVLVFHHYQSTVSIDKNDTEATDYASFGNMIIRYSDDGAAAIASDNTTVWEESYEMENPIISVRHSYLAVADQKGKTIIIFNKEGFCQQITTDLPIQKIDVSDTGSVAVLMQEDGNISYLSLYSLSGKKTAEGTLHFGSSGYPLALALSEDGENLALSILDVKSGQSNSTINFYNFSQMPEEGKDNQVASFTYEDTVIPQISYGANGKLAAIADNKFICFQGNNEPQEKAVVELPGTVRSIVYDADRIGLLYDQGEDGSGNTLILYDYDGDEKRTYSVEDQYSGVGFLSNGEVYLIQDKNLAIYRKFGRAKYIGTADTPFLTVMSEGYGLKYVFVREGTTEQVHLSLL